MEGYSGRGKDKVTVADELIDRAIEMGFLSEGGRVSFAIDSPDETLFEQYGIELRTEVENHLAGRMSVIIEIVPYQTKPSDQPQEIEPPVSTAPPTIPQQPQPQAPENDSDYDDGAAAMVPAIMATPMMGQVQVRPLSRHRLSATRLPRRIPIMGRGTVV